MSKKIKLKIWRGDAKDGALKDVEVEANEGEVVLDVIHRVQATQMGDLAVRWNCKAGKCGSCSMEINGKEVVVKQQNLPKMPNELFDLFDIHELEKYLSKDELPNNAGVRS